MRRSGILTASLLASVCALAADTPANFRIEFELSNPSGTKVSIPVRCTKGCEWEQTSIDCPQGETVCHATLHARSHPDSYQEVEIPKPVRPIKGSNCLGMALTSARAGGADSSQVAGARISKVLPTSPARQAGFQAGDIVTAFNTRPIGQASDLYQAILASPAGQPFEATVDRGGSRANITGIIGVQTTSDTCVLPDSGTLEGPAVTQEELKPAPFALTFHLQVSSVRLEATCFEGCAWHQLGLRAGERPDQAPGAPLEVTLDENGMASAGQSSH